MKPTWTTLIVYICVLSALLSVSGCIVIDGAL